MNAGVQGVNAGVNAGVQGVNAGVNALRDGVGDSSFTKTNRDRSLLRRGSMKALREGVEAAEKAAHLVVASAAGAFAASHRT